jgi:hypothetical protein
VLGRGKGVSFENNSMEETLFTYPSEYKQLQGAFPRSAFGGSHATIRSNEGLAT